MQKKIGIVGAGRLGTALAMQFKQKGACLTGVSCKTFEETKHIAEALGVKPYEYNRDLAKNSDILFITVPDNAIINIVKELMTEDLPNDLCIIHCSGALSALELPVDERVHRASFHPLQSFASGDARFKDIYIAMDGDDYALAIARELCLMLGARPLNIPSKDRALYHATACITSNHLVAILSVAEGLFAKWTDSPEEARKAMWPLIQGSLENYKKYGPKGALTGPIARGDNKTIEKHLNVLPKEQQDFYKILSLATLDLAAKSGAISVEKIDQISKLLKLKE